MQQSQPRGEPHPVVTALYLLLLLGIQAWAVWIMLPPQQRMWIRLAVAGTVRSKSATAAWRQGHQGMGEELATGQRSVRYLAAWGLSTVRDRANKSLEAMRP